MNLLEQIATLTEIIEELDQVPRVPISYMATDLNLDPITMTGNYSAIYTASVWGSHPARGMDTIRTYFKPGERWQKDMRKMIPFSGFLSSCGWQHNHESNRIVSVRASDGYVHKITPDTLIYVSIDAVDMARVIDDFQRILGIVKDGRQELKKPPDAGE